VGRIRAEFGEADAALAVAEAMKALGSVMGRRRLRS
jgi:hypothetical protein